MVISRGREDLGEVLGGDKMGSLPRTGGHVREMSWATSKKGVGQDVLVSGEALSGSYQIRAEVACEDKTIKSIRSCDIGDSDGGGGIGNKVVLSKKRHLESSEAVVVNRIKDKHEDNPSSEEMVMMITSQANDDLGCTVNSTLSGVTERCQVANKTTPLEGVGATVQGAVSLLGSDGIGRQHKKKKKRRSSTASTLGGDKRDDIDDIFGDMF